jgi:long-chain acyl-CoA synthetase
MLPHRALLSNCRAVHSLLRRMQLPSASRYLSFLPLSHSYEHTVGGFLMPSFGLETVFSRGADKLLADFAEHRPQLVTAVPRLFEVLKERIEAQIAKDKPWKQRLFRRAVALGLRRMDGPPLNWLERAQDRVLDRLVRDKVRARFGGALAALVSGGARLDPDLSGFFMALGVPIIQGYGQTEAGPVISCNRPRAGVRMDTVGPPLKDTEVRIAEDGEIMVRGENVMHGYWRSPEESARVLQDGWLATGDVGHLDDKGRIVITDRKKDLIVNDKGDNVSPQRVEGMLTLQPEIAQAMVYGDRRPYLVALLVPDPDMARLPDVEQRLRAAIDRVNAELSVIEKVRRFVVADEPFSIDNEQLTPSMKIRRHVIKQAYSERLDALYKR